MENEVEGYSLTTHSTLPLSQRFSSQRLVSSAGQMDGLFRSAS
ncbi:MAG TPA: hypothetical protein VF528_15725 [Pyrinomonadaceae bacterium]